MAIRSQMRLAQISGSLDSTIAYAPSGIDVDSLQGVMDHMASAIKRITGADNYHSSDNGQFAHAITGSHGLKFDGDLDINSFADIAGPTNLGSSLDVAAAVTFAQTGGNASGPDLSVAGFAKFDSSLKLGGAATDTVVFTADIESNLLPSSDSTYNLGADAERWAAAYVDDIDAATATLGSAKVSDLTDNEIVIAGASGELEGDAKFRFNGSHFDIGVADSEKFRVAVADGATTIEGAIDANSSLDVAGAVALGASGGSADTSVRGDLSVAEDLSVSGNATVTGKLTVSADLEVAGALTYVNTQDLNITDKKVVIALSGSGANLDGAGIYLGSEASGENIQWDATNSKWKSSNQFYAPTLESDVTSAVFLASDADGDIIAGTASTLATHLANQFSGSNIAVAESAGVITYSLTEGTGVHMNAGEISIGQAVETTSDVQFADISADSIKLADEAVANVGKALKLGTDGLVTASAWDEFVSVEADLGLTIGEDGFKAKFTLAQDIRTSADPQFAGLNLGSAGDALTLYDGSEGSDGSADLKIAAIEEMHLEDGYKSGSSFSGPLALASASADWSAYASAFGEVSLLEAIVAASVGDQYASKFEHVHSGAADSSIDSWTALGGSITFAQLMDMPADSKKARIEVYVNGQLMSQNTDGQNDRDYSFITTDDAEALAFEFDIENDDVVQIIVR